ncbi:MAG: carboxypeptidase regulatory-like domain-containing protein [Planctomycetes bacterium]|nr:carboxypeptidase regulatory-like domain-containing protein [Planctomycetota bacterium]
MTNPDEPTPRPRASARRRPPAKRKASKKPIVVAGAIGIAGIVAIALSTTGANSEPVRRITELVVRCVDGAGKPLAHVDVAFHAKDRPLEEPSLRTRSDAEGRAVLPAEIARGAWYCVGKSAELGSVSQCFIEQGDVTRELMVDVPADIEGSVVNSAGDPVPGAIVEARIVQGPVLATTKSDDGGAFVIQGFSSSLPFLQLIARQIGHANAEGSWDRHATEPVQLTLTKTKPLRVRVTGPDGAPMAKLKVSIVGYSDHVLETDTEGKGEFAGLLYGEPYFLHIDHPFFTYRYQAYSPRSDAYEVHLQRPHSLRAVAVDTGGVPIPGIEIRHRHGPRRWVRTTTDANGRFVLGDLPAGRVELWFEGNEREGNVDVEIAEQSSTTDDSGERKVVLQ